MGIRFLNLHMGTFRRLVGQTRLYGTDKRLWQRQKWRNLLGLKPSIFFWGVNLSGPQFFQTPMGRKFYEHDFPQMIRTLQELTKALNGKEIAPSDLSMLYHNVERTLSHALQEPGIGHIELLKEVTTARDNLREIMRRMGWKGQF